MAISSRIPKLGQIAPVYSVIVIMIYSWTSLWFFWKLPSWLYFLSIGEILTAFAYAIVTNLLESLAVLAMPMFLSLLLPKKWFYDLFVVRGTSLIVLGLGYMMYLSFQFRTKEDYPSDLLRLSPLVLGLILLTVFIAGKVNFLRKAIEFFADRATVFLYVSIPISAVSLLVVGVRIFS